jgi:hypothetical protein
MCWLWLHQEFGAGGWVVSVCDWGDCVGLLLDDLFSDLADVVEELVCGGGLA